MAETTISTSAVMENCSVVHTALQQCASSDILLLPSVKALTSLSICKDMCINFDSSNEDTRYLCKEVVCSLLKCIPSATKMTKRWKERMWKDFHSTRTSDLYRSAWSRLFQVTIGTTNDVEPLYQHVTDTIFYGLLSPTSKSNTVEKMPVVVDLSDDEENTLRYIGGYVVSKVKKRILASKHSLRKELLIGLDDLIDNEGSNGEGSSTQWVQSLDRGGLCKISEDAHTLFYEMEMLVKRYLNEQEMKNMDDEFKKKIIGVLKDDEDITFVWEGITTEIGDTERKYLFQKFADLYFAVRGNSFATAMMEQYKKASKKRVQKSKGTRKKVNTD